jgi:hypothetical protein
VAEDPPHGQELLVIVRTFLLRVRFVHPLQALPDEPCELVKSHLSAAGQGFVVHLGAPILRDYVPHDSTDGS